MKKTVRLSETDLHRLVGKAVSRILNEYSDKSPFGTPEKVHGFGGRMKANKQMRGMSQSALSDFNDPEGFKKTDVEQLWTKFNEEIIDAVSQLRIPGSRTTNEKEAAIPEFVSKLKGITQNTFKTMDKIHGDESIYEGRYVDDYNKKADQYAVNIRKNRDRNMHSYTINNVCKAIANLFNSGLWTTVQRAITAKAQQEKGAWSEGFKGLYDSLNRIKANAEWFLDHTFEAQRYQDMEADR